MSAIFTRSCFFNTYTFAFNCTKKMPTILIFIEKAKFHLMPCGSISFELFLCRQSFNKLWILTHCTQTLVIYVKSRSSVLISILIALHQVILYKYLIP